MRQNFLEKRGKILIFWMGCRQYVPTNHPPDKILRPFFKNTFKNLYSRREKKVYRRPISAWHTARIRVMTVMKDVKQDYLRGQILKELIAQRRMTLKSFLHTIHQRRTPPNKGLLWTW